MATLRVYGLIGILISCFFGPSVHAYSQAKIYNHTDKKIKSGKVNYASAFCADDKIKKSKGHWVGDSSRGACLITKITVNINGEKVKHYSSSGTSYSVFYVIEEKGHYRIVSNHEYNGTSKGGYPFAKVVNYSMHKATGTVAYSSAFCSDDAYSVGPAKMEKGKLIPTTWKAKSRGVCLVDKITAKLSNKEKVVSYGSSGTSYGTFQIRPTQSGYRVFSAGEYAKHIDAQHGKSPGFYIHNKTDWPVAISLDQTGCLYYDVVDSGKVFKRDTGSVWFTISANIQPDGKLPNSDLDCIEPVAKIVGATLLAAATGGYGAYAAAAAEGASITATVVAVGAGTAALTSLGHETYDIIGELLVDNGNLKLVSQYAGYGWPFRCDKMPSYEITGGPTLEFKDGKAVLGGGTTFTLKKINDCGEDMMKNTKATAPNTIDWDAEIAKQHKP